MPRASDGTMTLDGIFAIASTVPLSPTINSYIGDLVTETSDSVSRSGKGGWRANLSAGGYRLYNLGDGTALTDAVNLRQVRNNTLSVASVVGGTGDAITLTFAPPFIAYTTGMTYWFKAAAANTVTAPTVNIDGLGPKTIKKQLGVALMPYDIPAAGFICECYYDGTDMILINPAEYANRTAESYNRVLNGGILISQENGVTALTTSAAYTVDQFRGQWNSTGTFTHQFVQVTTPNGSRSRLRLTVNTADTSVTTTDLLGFTTQIEGVRIQDFLWGTASAKQAIFRFGIKAPAGTYSVAFRNALTATRTYVANYTITAGQANTNTEQIIIIPGDVTGTWTIDNNMGMEIWFTFATGPTYQAPSTGWNAGNYVGTSATSNGMGTAGNVFELFDIGLYRDPQNTGVPPRWQMVDYQQELAACQRYWCTRMYHIRSRGAAASQYHEDTIWFPVPMRVQPSATIISAPSRSNLSVLNLDMSGNESCRIESACTTQGDFYALYEVASFNARM